MNDYENKNTNNTSSTIIQPSSNPGFQVNNGFNKQNNLNKNISPIKYRKSISIKPFIILIIFIALILLIAYGFKKIASKVDVPSPVEDSINNIDTSKILTAKSTVNEYFNQIENYTITSMLDSDAINIPESKNGIVKCSKINSDIWSGEVLPSSSSCDDFMNAIEKNYRGIKPTSGEIIFDKNGNVINNSWLIIDNIYCTYDGEKSVCSTKKPE